MKSKLLTLFSLLALLLVSTSILADGRPTGIRIGRAVGSGGSTTPTAEIDITVTGTDYQYSNTPASNVWLNNEVYANGTFNAQFASSAFSEPLPWAIDWGDGSYFSNVPLFGPPGGPWRGSFAHTYSGPGAYTITVGDAVCCGYNPDVYTGNAITGRVRYVYDNFSNTYDTFSYTNPATFAITATTTVRTGFGIPTLNIYGLLAMAFVLVGTGVLLFRKPQQA